MSSIHTALLVLHIASGFIALITGTLAAITRKGRGNHSKLGKLFVTSMYGVAFSGIPLAVMGKSVFVGALAIFTLHMSITGSRAFKGMSKKGRLIMSISALAGALSLLLVGVLILVQHGNTMGIVALTFGGLLLSMSIRDWRIFRGSIQPKAMNLHINQMGGSLIAAYTAFFSIGATRIFSLIGADLSQWSAFFWLLPTVVGSILLTRANMKYAPRPSKATASV